MESDLREKPVSILKIPMKKAIPRYLAIKIILVSFLFSCKTSNTNVYKDKETYKIINTLLDVYFLKNEEAYLHPKIIEKQSYIIRDFKTEKGYYGACNKTLIKKIFTEEDFNAYKNQENLAIAWNYRHIKNPKVITELELKSPSLIKRFEGHKKVAKDKYDLLIRKYVVWSIENRGSLIQLSLPFLSNDGLYAAVFMSRTNYGTFLWILEKKNKIWEVVCSMELSVY